MDFWQVHGVFFLIGMVFIPRMTMLFWIPVPFGVFSWLGWIFLPRLLAAFLAFKYYGDTNPILVACSIWLALGEIISRVKGRKEDV